jgi:hypothetical protein
MNDQISPHYFFNHCFCLSVVHSPDFVDPRLIPLFETLVLFLKFLIGLCKLLVDLSVVVVCLLERNLILLKVRLLRPDHVFQLALTLL